MAQSRVNSIEINRNGLLEALLSKDFARATFIMDTLKERWTSDVRRPFSREENFCLEILLKRPDSALTSYRDAYYKADLGKTYFKTLPKDDQIIDNWAALYQWAQSDTSYKTSGRITTEEKELLEHILNGGLVIPQQYWYGPTLDLPIVLNTRNLLKRYPNTTYRAFLETLDSKEYLVLYERGFAYDWLFGVAFPIGSLSNLYRPGFHMSFGPRYDWERFRFGYGLDFTWFPSNQERILGKDTLKKGNDYSIGSLYFRPSYLLSRKNSWSMWVNAQYSFGSGNYDFVKQPSGDYYDGGSSAPLHSFALGAEIFYVGLRPKNYPRERWDNNCPKTKTRATFSARTQLAYFDNGSSERKGWYASVGLAFGFLVAKKARKTLPDYYERFLWKNFSKDQYDHYRLGRRGRRY